jgi:TctA family transporter
MLFSDGHLGIFWSNPLVGCLTTAALLMLFWPLISKALQTLTGLRKPQVAKPKSVL